MKKIWNEIKDYIFIILAVVLIRTFIVTPAIVDGGSMDNTLENGQLVLINKLTTPQIPWAAITNGGIIYIWIVLFYSIRKNINIAGHVLLQTIAISLLTVYIDFELQFKGWSINMVIPILVITSNIAMLILTIVSHKQFIKYVIYQLMILLFSFLPVIFITENMVQNKILSVIASGISIINLIISLALCTRDVKEVIIRKFHM